MDRPRRTKLSTFENLEYLRLQGILRKVRWRWRFKMLLRGLGLAAMAALLTLLAATWGLDAFRYRPLATVALSLLTYGALGYAAWRFLIRPLARPVTDAEVALFIEERAPGLRAALLSAVQFGSPEERRTLREVSPRLVEKVVEQALSHGESIRYGAAIDSDGMRRVSGLVSLAAIAIVATLAVNPAFLRQGMPRILKPWGAAEAATPYTIAVSPGNAEVARGGDQLITATLGGFDAERVEISLRIGAGEWERYPMITDAESGRREFMLLKLADTAEYVIEAEGVRSPLHRLDVVDVPYVDRIDLELDYPDYSGLPTETIEDGGDIAALAGTVATLRITPTVEVPGGRIVLTPAADGIEPQIVELSSADGTLRGSIEVSAPATYRVEFERYDGTLAEASSRYVIDVLADQPPVISIDEPGRDSSATLVEEVYIEASAADDYGLETFELVWSLNGAEESVVPLGGGGSRETVGSTTLYLEEQELEPGDFIAYYARAVDGARPAGQETATDIYFLTIRPFDREFRQAPSGGAGGGGMPGGGPQEMQGLSRRQRDIIAATFKINRDRERLDPEQVAEDLALLAGMQGELAERTRGVAAEAGMMPDESAVAGVEMLRVAASEMDDATAELSAERPVEAMVPEQRALQYLQRFEALVREMTLQMQQGGGGGGQGDAMTDDLLAMLDLETDDLQNQYESVQRQRQQEADNEVDAALQRLTELARRQQQELERQQAQAGQPGAGGRSESQRQTAQQAEELARQLERLARRNSDPEMQEAANRLREAADAMRQAAAQGGTEAGMADAARALAEMQDARRLLDRQREGRLDRDFSDATDRVERLQQEQERIRDEVAEMANRGTTREQMEELLERKDRLAGEIRDLEMQLDDMARGSREEQLEASRGLQEAAEFIRDAKLADKVRYSKGVVQERLGRFADDFEEGISQDLEQLADLVGEAAGSRTTQPGERLADAAEDARDLVRRLQSLEDRMREAQERQGQQGQQGQQDGQQGEEGRQPGQQQAGEPQESAGRLGGSNSGPPGPRQLSRELQQRLGDAEQLREALQAEGVQTTDLDGIISAMRDFDEEFIGTTRGLDELREDVIDELKMFEFWLRRMTDAAEGQRPQLGRPDSVPESYRALVEEYFRSLSRDGDAAQR